jgi:hypothetical protein
MVDPLALRCYRLKRLTATDCAWRSRRHVAGWAVPRARTARHGWFIAFSRGCYGPQHIVVCLRGVEIANMLRRGIDTPDTDSS